jgi:PKD repeat protein
MNKILNYMRLQSLLIPLLLLTAITISCNKTKEDTTATVIKPIFESDRQEISAGDSITFKDLSEGYVTRWKWTFEGGAPATSNLSSPTVTYTTPGTYAVTVELRNGDNKATLTKKDYIRVDYNQIKSDFTASATVSFTGQTVQFKDSSSGGPQTWLWEFVPVSGGTTLTSTEQNPSMVFTDTGYYNVSLTASNPSYSDKKTKARFIRIIDVNAVSADFSSDETATYAGGGIAFSDNSLGYVTAWQWNIQGPVTITSQEQNPVISFTTPGRYKVSLTASNSNKSITKSVDNYILVVPSDNLAAFFPFNGNIRDVGPNSIASNSLGAGVSFSSADRKGVQGNTAVFNGATGVILSNHAACNFGTSDYSISCWVKTPVTSKMMVWQESGKNGAKDNQTWLRLGDNTTDRVIRFDIEDGSGSAILNIGSASSVSDDQWHHLVAVRQGMVISVYIDGIKKGSLTASGLKDVSNDEDFKIGVQEGATSNSSFFNGEIDDVIIYNKALSDAEVLNLFNL